VNVSGVNMGSVHEYSRGQICISLDRYSPTKTNKREKMVYIDMPSFKLRLPRILLKFVHPP
jgi:hypothetical protein